MVDSRAKGQRAEYDVRDMLREATGLQWERVPGSGGLNAAHGMKGDVYLSPASGNLSRYAIEVKHYKEENFNSNIFKKTHSQLEKWLDQTYREAGEINAKPMLIFKKDRSPFIVCIDAKDELAEILRVLTHCTFYKGSREVIMVDFKEFLEIINPEDLAK